MCKCKHLSHSCTHLHPTLLGCKAKDGGVHFTTWGHTQMGVPFMIAHRVYSKTAANQNVIPLHLLFSITTNLILPKVSPFKSFQSVLSTLVTAAVGEYVSFFWKYIFMLSNGFVMRSIMFY